MLNAVTGRTDDLDYQTLDTLAWVIGRPLALDPPYLGQRSSLAGRFQRRPA
jgi:hypothetical protein